MEKDDEIKGNNNSYDFGSRIHDPRIGRFLSKDRFEMKFPNLSPYSYAANTPIWALDNNGDSVWVYSESIKATGGLGRHMFIRVKTTDRDVIIELYGTAPNGTVGQPQVNDYNSGSLDRQDVVYHQVYEPINTQDEDKFENDIIKYAEYIKSHNLYDGDGNVIDNPLLPTYDPWTANSNGYARALIEYAGGSVETPYIVTVEHMATWTPVAILPGAEWENLEPYFKILRDEYSRDEYYNNTYGMSQAALNQAIKMVNDFNSSQNQGNPSSPADALQVEKDYSNTRMKPPGEKPKKKSSNSGSVPRIK